LAVATLGHAGLDLFEFHATDVKSTLAALANAYIANFSLRDVCEYRMYPSMDAFSIALIDAFGGTSTVARLTKAPISTVHGWRRAGLAPSRLDHLRRIAQDEAPLVDVAALAAEYGVELSPIGPSVGTSCGKADEVSAPVIA
jgi:hypothetical protein